MYPGNDIMPTFYKNISLYVSTYAKYSAGNLDGIWLNFDEYPNFPALWQALVKYHEDEKQPEFMCQEAQGVDFTVPESVRAVDLLFLYRLSRDEDAEILSAFLALDPGEAPELPAGCTSFDFAILFVAFKERAMAAYAGRLDEVTWTQYPDFQDWCFSRFLAEHPGAAAYENYLDAEAIEREFSCYYTEKNGFIFRRHA